MLRFKLNHVNKWDPGSVPANNIVPLGSRTSQGIMVAKLRSNIFIEPVFHGTKKQKNNPGILLSPMLLYAGVFASGSIINPGHASKANGASIEKYLPAVKTLNIIDTVVGS